MTRVSVCVVTYRRGIAHARNAAVARIAQGTCLPPLAVITGRAEALRAARYVATGGGSLAGITGLRYQEYHATHGR